MRKFKILLFLTLIHLKCFSQFNSIKAVFTEEEAQHKSWDKTHTYSVKRDTAYLENGEILYRKFIQNDSICFIKYYPNGLIHILGKGLEQKGERLHFGRGSWTYFYPNGVIKKSIVYEEHLIIKSVSLYNDQGKLIKTVNPLPVYFGITYGLSLNQPKLKEVSILDFKANVEPGFLASLDYYLDLTKTFTMNLSLAGDFQNTSFLIDTNSSVRRTYKNSDVFLSLPIRVYSKLSEKLSLGTGLESNIKLIEGRLDDEYQRFDTSNFNLFGSFQVKYQVLKFSDFSAFLEISHRRQINNYKIDFVYPEERIKINTTFISLKLVART
jgi:hypothetical protein